MIVILKISEFVTHQFGRVIDVGCSLSCLCASSIILLDDDHGNANSNYIMHKLLAPATTEITIVKGKELMEVS